MIIQQKTSSIEQIGNVTQESEFKMRTSQKAFQILSSLYSDKPLAIVRELGCNAMDSHIAAGQPNVPFHVHVPNTLEPWLTIQDYGTGISHDSIYEIYSVYFASTKTNTNTQVGMLGLGSKSPFCYTDNFTITSIHNQVKRVYNAYFNQNGMPTISLASQENTTDGNGVAIQIPVKQSDLNDFARAVKVAFRFFDIKPIITGGVVDWSDDVAMFESTFWKSYSGLSSSYAIMGGVAYPIDTYKIANEHYDIVRKAGLVIKFNIGELDVTPSREALMYHDWVVKALNDKIELVKKDFLLRVEEKIRDSENLLDAMKALYLLREQWSFLNSTMINGNVLWKKIDISEPRRSIKAIAPSIKSYSKRQWGRAKWTESEYASLHNDALWYYDNLKRGSIKRIVNHVRYNGNSDIAVNLVTESDMKHLIAKGFPASIFIPTSTLPAIASNRASGIKNSKPKGVINIYKFGYQYRESWEPQQFDLATGTAPKYYIVKNVDNWRFFTGRISNPTNTFNVSICNKAMLQEICQYFGIDIDKDVRMVSTNNAKFLDKLGSTNLADVIKKKKIDVDWNLISQCQAIDLQVIENIKKNAKFKALPTTNQFKTFINGMDDGIAETKKLKNLIKFVKDETKNSLTYPNQLVKLMYLACDTWQVGIDAVMDAATELN